jgi:hypothetical protein
VAQDRAHQIYIICDEKDRKICDEKDRKATVPLRKYLKTKGFEVSPPGLRGRRRRGARGESGAADKLRCRHPLLRCRGRGVETHHRPRQRSFGRGRKPLLCGPRMPWSTKARPKRFCSRWKHKTRVPRTCWKPNRSSSRASRKPWKRESFQKFRCSEGLGGCLFAGRGDCYYGLEFSSFLESKRRQRDRYISSRCSEDRDALRKDSMESDG